MVKNKVWETYQELLLKHSRPQGQWKLWCKRPKNKREREEVIIGSILAQNTNWQNAEKALSELKKENLCSLKKIYQLGKKNERKLAQTVRSSGFYNQKSSCLISLTETIMTNYNGIELMKKESGEDLRKTLLSVKGVGKETADSILLYALDKPFFVIDEYTKRLASKKRLANNFFYDFLQDLFEQSLAKDYSLYQDFHALIVIEGQCN